MQAPVRKRKATTAADAGSTSRIAPLAAAATKAAPAKRRFAGMRSARPRIALRSVPATKPTATALENSEARRSPSPASARSAGTVAVAENQRPSASTSASDRIVSDRHLDFRERAGSGDPGSGGGGATAMPASVPPRPSLAEIRRPAQAARPLSYRPSRACL